MLLKNLLGYSAIPAGACALRAVTCIDIPMAKLSLIRHQLPGSVLVGNGTFLGGDAEVEALFDRSMTLLQVSCSPCPCR